MVFWWVAGGDARGAVGVGRTANSACAGPGWYDGQECKAADLLQTQEERGRVGAAQVAAAGQCKWVQPKPNAAGRVASPRFSACMLAIEGASSGVWVVAVAAWRVAPGDRTALPWVHAALMAAHLAPAIWVSIAEQALKCGTISWTRCKQRAAPCRTPGRRAACTAALKNTGRAASPLIPASFASAARTPRTCSLTPRTSIRAASPAHRLLLARCVSRAHLPALPAMGAAMPAAIVLSGLMVGGGVCAFVRAVVRLGDSIDRLGDSISAFLPAFNELAYTLANGPRRPRLLQFFFGRGCGTNTLPQCSRARVAAGARVIIPQICVRCVSPAMSTR